MKDIGFFENKYKKKLKKKLTNGIFYIILTTEFIVVRYFP